jgi:hypothetical protein
LASYLILVGVYSTALSVANDAELRRSIRKSVQENSELLGNIGEAQFEDQLQKTVIKKITDLSEKIIEEIGIASSLEERDRSVSIIFQPYYSLHRSLLRG